MSFHRLNPFIRSFIDGQLECSSLFAQLLQLNSVEIDNRFSQFITGNSPNMEGPFYIISTKRNELSSSS